MYILQFYRSLSACAIFFPTRVRTCWVGWVVGPRLWLIMKTLSRGPTWRWGTCRSTVRFDWRCLRHFWRMTWWCLFSHVLPRKMGEHLHISSTNRWVPMVPVFCEMDGGWTKSANLCQNSYCWFDCSCSYFFDNFWLVLIFGSGSSTCFSSPIFLCIDQAFLSFASIYLLYYTYLQNINQHLAFLYMRGLQPSLPFHEFKMCSFSRHSWWFGWFWGPLKSSSISVHGNFVAIMVDSCVVFKKHVNAQRIPLVSGRGLWWITSFESCLYMNMLKHPKNSPRFVSS